MTGKNKEMKARRDAPYRAADYLKTPKDIAGFLEAVIEDGDPRTLVVALRDAADATGGVGALAQRTGLNRETLYRTLSGRGNPQLDTLTVLLGAFGLRLSVRPMKAA